ncbi:peptidoglycan recognition protein family protein [Streptomyces chartreusis]|uniref:peptidoglycan recognition protein family protein n=1 Tax=Streptomyces chartreusis TaxID=1969 RepID=UPI0036AA17D5
MQKTGFPIGTVSVEWIGATDGMRIRFYNEEGNPGTWQTVKAGCPCGKDPESFFSMAVPERALVLAKGASAYELRPEKGAVLLDAVAIQAEDLPADTRPKAPSPLPSPPAPRMMGSDRAHGGLRIDKFVSRAAWGADESKRLAKDGSEKSPVQFHPVQAVTVHHTVTSNHDPNPGATVRTIYTLHTVGNDWGDIGYHFLIDADGNVYEGRWSGRDNTPAHDSVGRVVTAFHTRSFNAGNIGIALLGDFTNEELSERMRTALVKLVAALFQRHALSPQSDITYINPVSGQRAKASTLNGHRDWNSTECPGDRTYLQIPDLRASVANEIKRNR